MQKLEHIHIERIVAHYSAIPDIDSEAKLYGLATVLLRHYLGNEWASENVNIEHEEVHKRGRTGRSFFRTDSEEAEESLRHQERIVRLSELLYNLQNVDGIEERLVSLQSGMLEATYAELEFAGHFHSRNVRVKFRERSGTKSQDYDFTATFGANLEVCCEVKCKLEETDLGKNTIINTLIDARKQLPENALGIIGVKIPEAWVRINESGPILVSALNDLFRNSNRVIGVVVRWEETQLMPEGGGWIVYKFRVHWNQNMQSADPDLLQFIEVFSNKVNNRWISLRGFV